MTASLNSYVNSKGTSVAAVQQAIQDENSSFRSNIQQQKAIMQSLMVRRQEDSRGWHNEPLRDIGVSDIYNVEVEGTWEPELRDAVATVLKVSRGENKHNKVSPTINSSSMKTTGRIARCVADIPWLAIYMKANPNFGATQREIIEAKWDVRPKSLPFWQHREAILKSSPKLRRLIRIRNKQTKDINKRAEKLVIFSDFPVVVFIIRIVSIPVSSNGGYTNKVIDIDVEISQCKSRSDLGRYEAREAWRVC